MKRKLRFIIGGIAASVLACSTLAQDTDTPKTDRPDYTRQRIEQPQADRLNGAAKASDLLGMKVINYQDEKLGTVEDIEVDVESGRIVQVIIFTRGFIGFGVTLAAVPPGALHHDAAQKVLHLDADKAKLAAAPIYSKYQLTRWDQCCDVDYLSALYSHYGQESAFKSILHTGDPTNDVANTVATRNADGTWNKDRLPSESQLTIPTTRLARIQMASDLMGIQVKNLQDEKLGKVKNILLDLPSGRIVALVVSSGGYLGTGNELTAVPPTALQFRTGLIRDKLHLDASKEMLSGAPHFKANQWPDFGQPSYAGGVYRAYNLEPYFSTDPTKDIDSTAQNVRDQSDRTPAPLAQGNSSADVDTTAQIRAEIIAGKDMSVNARSVKITTNKGQVTLRGPVDTAEEKRLIGEIANGIAKVGNVNNRLEVK